MTHAQILVVEDERIVARGIQNELEQMGYGVPELASSGEEAIEKAGRLHPDLILMDIVLKGRMDGIEAAQTIRERFDIPVIYLSAYEDEKSLGRARSTEPFGYLLKPYEEKELHTTIEMALHKHRMEQRLKQAERWLAATLRSIDDAVIATDARLNVRFLNPAAQMLTGWEATEALDRELAEVCPLTDERTGSSMANLAAHAIRDNRGINLPDHLLLTAVDGRQTPVEGNLAPIADEDGCFTGIVLVVRDVTERRQLEQTRLLAEEQRRQTEKMEAVSRLAGGIAHDFNNLLTVVLGNTSLALARLEPADPNRELLASAEKAALRAAQLVEQLLSSSGQHRLTLKPLELNAFIQEMLGMLRRNLDSQIALDFTPGLDLWTVQADQAQLSEVLINLAQNAQETMPDGGRLFIETENVTIETDYPHAHPRAQPGEYVRLRFQDTGCGFPTSDPEQVFEPMLAAKVTGKGSSLGMALVFSAVEQHHGWIESCRSLDQGTLYDIYLPRYWQRPVQAAPAAPVKRSRTDPKTILLADDEPMLRELGQTVLEQKGYRVLLAEDGQQAVDIFEKDRDGIDLVILDLTMPRLSGKDAWRTMLDIDPAVRVLFSSGYFAEDMTAEEGRIMGFIDKPYRPHELLDIVRSALEHAKPETPEEVFPAE